MKSAHQRRHYLISYRFQLRFALQIIVLLSFTSVVVGWTVYYSMWNASTGELRSWVAQDKIDPADVAQLQEAIRSELKEKILIRILLLIFIAFVFTVFATHRMAGPIRHIEKTLSARLRGESAPPIRLRRTDEFQDLAALINRVLASGSEKADAESSHLHKRGDS